MRLIDHLRQNPLVMDPITGKQNYDTRQLINADTQVFVVDELASMVIQKTVNHPEVNQEQVNYTERGMEWLKCRPTAGDPQGRRELHQEEFVGVIPPFDNCFFEYRHPCCEVDPASQFQRIKTEYEGVHIMATSHPDTLAALNFNRPPDTPEIKFVMHANVLYRSIGPHRGICGIDSEALICTDTEGRVIYFNRHPRATPQQVANNPSCGVPNLSQYLVTMLAMMMLGTKVGTAVQSPEVKETRQQRRYRERHPNRATPPPVRYWTLEVDPNVIAPDTPGTSGKGGWEVCWHRVRGHLRHLKSGKVVPIRAHSKGNPLKGVIFKDYAVLPPEQGTHPVP
jgi:hypothetical protein